MKRKVYLLTMAFLLALTSAAQAPKADILDVVFNDDGTAKDVSAMQNEVLRVGSPYVEKSLKYGINEACFRNNLWGDTPKGYFRVDYEENEAFHEALAGSHSFEALIRPLADPAEYDVVCKFFSNQQSGGGNLSVRAQSGNYELSYSDYIGDATQTVSSGVVPVPGTYYHVIGVWDKEEGIISIYVNGESCGEKEVDGAYKEPSSGSQWFSVGSDPSTKGNSTNAFAGDIAIARIYGFALSADDVAALYNGVKAMDTNADEHVDVQEYDPYLMVTTSANNITVTDLGEYNYRMETTGGDPYVQWSSLQKTLGEDQTVITFEYKCPQGAPSSEFFFSPIAGGREMTFDIPAAEDWTPFYLDLAGAMASFNWGKVGDNLRLDIANEAGITMDIRNIHFITKSEYLTIIGAGELNLEKDAEGYYLVGSPEELMTFAEAVNLGTYTDIKLRQIADINLGGMDWTPIGAGSNYSGAASVESVTNPGFEGVYDGQGHTISNFTILENSDAIGLFGIVTGTVKNLGVTDVKFNATKDCRAGGIAGTVTASAKNEGLVENCYVMNSSILTTGRVCGGVVGAVCGGVVRNCYGLNNELSGYGDRFGGVAGDTRNDAAWVGTVINCYTDHPRVTSSQSGTTNNSQGGISAERFASGEVTTKLNGTTTEASVWRQNIGEDDYPVLDPTHGYVLASGEEYISISEDNLSSVIDQIYTAESDYCANAICLLSLKDSYEQLLDSFTEVSDMSGFFEMYAKIATKKDELKASASGYAAYMEKVAEVRAYLAENTNVIGPYREALDSYLNEEFEPNETFPNGSYDYIIKQLALDNDELEAEAALVQEMKDKAIASGYTEGSDVTSLMVNPDFSEGTKGWSVENGSLDISNVTGAGTEYVAHSNGQTIVSQTLQGMTPGIYQIKVNAAYRAAGDDYNLNQAAFVFANNNKVYAPTLREGIIPTDSESPYLDKYVPVLDDEANVIGYMPNSPNPMAYAFGEGYYENTIVTEVGEDGILTLGVSTPGCNTLNDTWIGAFHLLYCGAAETTYSNAAFDETLNCQLERLNSLAYDYDYDSYDYSATPNYSEELKGRVLAAVQAGPASTEKYAQITSLGNLMQEVYDCKKVYATMLAKAEIALDLYADMEESGMITKEEGDKLLEAYNVISGAYLDGTYSIEEAQAADPFEGVSLMPVIDGNVAQISSAKELIMFSAMVNSGFYRTLDAVLMNDIDMDGVNYYAPIGYPILSELNHTGQPITNPGYAGTFDGQGHVIKNLTADYNSLYAASGVFGTITGTVKNLGVVNYHFVMSEAPASYSGRFGALCGQLVEGTILNCYVTGSTVVNTNEIVSSIAAGNYGGVVQNCYEYGNVIQPYPRAGQLVGDARDDNGVRIGTEINCYSEGFVTGAGRANGYPSNMSNCENQVASARFKSGEIAFKLNGGAISPEEVVWYQTISEDDSPVLDNTHYIVRQTESGAYTNFDDTSAGLLALVEEAQTLISYTKISDHEPLILSSGQLSDNCLWQEPYTIQTIIDGDVSTYFHSRIDTPLDLGTEYFQVALNAPVLGFYLEYTGRSDGEASGIAWHDTPDRIRVMATNTPSNEDSWKEISIEQYDIPNTHGAHYKSEAPIMLGDSYQYIRFYVLHATSNNNYWNIAEFQMYNAAEASASLYDSDPEVAQAADALEQAAEAKLALVKSGTATQADIDELQALIDTLRKLAGIVKQHEGTKEDPFEIATADQLTDLHNRLKTGEMTYVILTDDIDLSEVDNWVPLNDASNTADGKSWMNWIDFDGKGHVIRNLTCTSESGYDYASIFGVFCGNLRNVGFENVYVSCTTTGGGVLGGYMGHNNFTDETGNKQTSKIENVWVTGELYVSSSYCGGLIGNIGGPSIIKNCYTNLKINSEATYTGGLVGRVRDALTMENVYAAGTINKGGGIVGGGQNSSTPASTYTNCVVWIQGADFGSKADEDVVSGEYYYNGTNFADLQQLVVGWGDPWMCDMAEGSYPVFDKEKLTATGEEEQPLEADHSRKLLLETSQLSDNCYWAFPSLDMSVNTLLDGSMTTHFHSDATNATPISDLNQYIQMDLREAQKAVQIYFAGRNLEPIGPVTNPSIEMINTPNHIIILATNTPDDEETWKQVAEFTKGFPGVVVGGEYYSPCFDMGDEYRYLRMVVKGAEQSQVYWNISELQVYPAKGATGIEQLMVQPMRMQSNGIYSIDGRLISRDPADVKSLSKGLYIIGGRKVMVK